MLGLVPEALRLCGFEDVLTSKKGQLKFVDARRRGGEIVRFWLKQGWTGEDKIGAIQFGMFGGQQGESIEDSQFLKLVEDRLASVRAAGASHGLIVQMDADGGLACMLALTLDGVMEAYREQMTSWPKRARNTKSATLWFRDDRNVPGAACVDAVTTRAVDLPALACDDSSKMPGWLAGALAGGAAVKIVTAEIERRLKQSAFRAVLGDHYGWKCAVSGTGIKEVLDAAHLPGKNWRTDNTTGDGILLRTDLHRLLDAGLAVIEDGRFKIAPDARTAEYERWHDVAVGRK